MKLAIVVLLAAVALVAAADADTESEVVSEHFGSSDGMVKAHVVQSVKLFLNPNAAVVAKTVKHLPSHSNANANANADANADRIIGNVFETSNFEAQEVESEADAEEEASFAEVDAEAEAEAETEEAEPSIPKSAPIAKLKASLIKAEAAAVVPDMTLPPHNAPTNANAPLNAVQPLSGPKPVAVMDEAAEKASHLYIGYEGPELPTGLEIKRPVDTSGTIGTEAGTKFNFNKKQIKGAKCANGCQLKVPVMVGYRGVKEWPAESTRNVRMPGDRENWRHIHEDLETPKGTSWYKPDLHSAGRHIKKVTRKLGKYRRTRKAYEDTALNRRVVVPQYDKPDY